MPILVTFTCVVLSPKPVRAIPAFARRYNVKCYNCHTIPPVLNKTGYMFKRLGYRMPPDDMDGTKPAPKISDLNEDLKFSLTNTMALVTQGSFTAEKTTGGDTPTSNTSFNLDEAALFASGWVPQTNFSYFVQYELYQDGESFLEQANAIYTGGRANSSYFAKAGQMHLQEGEGTRGAMMFSLFPEPALLLTNSNALNYTFDQAPVGVGAGYTWASPYFKQILAVSGKVTNGLNADGSEILAGSTKNSKDFWFDGDYWFGPDGGVTFSMVHGTKDQIQNEGLDSEFTYRPTIRRYGVFGNYLFFDKLDILGGYLHGRDDWEDMENGAVTNLTTNGLHGEVDYYFFPGFAAMARYDQLNQTIEGTPTTRSSNWGVGTEKALTELGNVVLRGSYNQLRAVDPVSQTAFTDKIFEVDFRLMW